MRSRPRQRRSSGFFGGDARSDSSDVAVSLWKFWGPRYWRVWLFIAWLRIVACLPWRQSIALHKWLGRQLGARSRSRMKLVRSNLELCFPELSSRERDEIAADFAANMGAVVAEIAMAWFASGKRLRTLVEVEGIEHLERALAKGKGVILAAGHFTPFEICGPVIKDYVPRYTLVYNKRRSRLLNEIQRRRRERYADETYPKGAVRAIVRSLRNNGAVWFAADESFSEQSAARIEFFGAPVLMSTATARLARLSGAEVVPLHFRRRSDESGYIIEFEPALEDFPTDDVVQDTKRMVSILENAIRRCPAQYFWSQRRFREEHASAR
ncbi:MAG TPA: lysophospholipid acyltransferase family protein [Gammaproteobacteria bacterium]|nr:lysophospholipid acyltransferase family protein [Gammaproteobacteria bacterium]